MLGSSGTAAEPRGLPSASTYACGASIHDRVPSPGPGGWWLDVEVCESKSKSSHRVIVGRAFMETVKATSPRQVLEGAFAVLIANKVPRKTEGIITSENFPVNYFTAANVAAWFPEFEIGRAHV